MIELKNVYDKVFLTIDTNLLNRWVEATWYGYPTEENLRTGVAAYTQALANTKANHILIDAREMIGTWEHSLKWMLEDWAPLAAQMGLEYYALVVAPETFAEEAAMNMQENLYSFRAKVFNDLEKAKVWLKNQG